MIEGIKEGIEKGLEKGKKEKAVEIAKSLLNMGIDIEKVSKATDLTIEKLERQR